MKKFPFLVPVIVAMLVLPYFSCKSTSTAPEEPPSPPLQAEPPQTAPAPALSQAVLDELNAAIARAEEARKRAGDFEGDSYFPSDWESAEEQYNSAKSMPRGVDSEAQSATAAYNAAADAYDSIFDLTIPLYAQAREDEIMALWNELVTAGARDEYPQFFAPADTTAVQAYDQYNAKDYYASKDSAAKALTMYQALKTGLSAWLAREEVLGWGFESNDPDNFGQADKTGLAAIEAYEAGDIESALAGAGEARDQYNTILSAGWPVYAEEHSTFVETERQAALNMKANIATHDIFEEADANYNSAMASYSSQNYEDASRQFAKAESLYIAARNTTSEKRRTAEDAILEATERINESVETARQADVIIEGGSE